MLKEKEKAAVERAVKFYDDIIINHSDRYYCNRILGRVIWEYLYSVLLDSTDISIKYLLKNLILPPEEDFDDPGEIWELVDYGGFGGSEKVSDLISNFFHVRSISYDEKDHLDYMDTEDMAICYDLLIKEEIFQKEEINDQLIRALQHLNFFDEESYCDIYLIGCKLPRNYTLRSIWYGYCDSYYPVTIQGKPWILFRVGPVENQENGVNGYICSESLFDLNPRILLDGKGW